MSVEGVSEVIANLERLGVDVGKATSKAIKAAAFKVQRDAIKSIQSEQSQGITYTRGSVSHTASKPGDAPNSDTGRLAGSIMTQIEFDVAWVFTDLDYGRWLEFGTMKIDPRPWLGPALNNNGGFLLEHLKKQLKAALNK